MEYSEFIKDYPDDAGAHPEDFDRALLSLEKHGLNKDVVLNAPVPLHRMKGSSCMTGFESFKTCLHHAEEALK